MRLPYAQDNQDIDITQPINHVNFEATLARYPIGEYWTGLKCDQSKRLGCLNGGWLGKGVPLVRDGACNTSVCPKVTPALALNASAESVCDCVSCSHLSTRTD